MRSSWVHTQELRIDATDQHFEAGKTAPSTESGLLGRFAGPDEGENGGGRDIGGPQQFRETKGRRRPHGPENPFRLCGLAGPGNPERGSGATSAPIRAVGGPPR